MKNLTTIFAALCAIVLGSCTSGVEEEFAPTPAETVLPDLTAGFADDNQTKTFVENGKYLRWHAADEISVFFGNTLNSQYMFTGETGANSGNFSAVSSGQLGTGNALDAIYAVYPYDAAARITDEGVISLTLPATQSYAENSFGKGANTMIATTQSTKDTFLPFKNACGYLTLKLYNANGAKLRSVEIKGNAGEKIAGAATATIEYGEAPVLVMGETATTSVTLDCGEQGIELGTSADAATELWIALPATTFASGITITATDTKGITFEKSTSKTVDITRNDIQPMAALGVEFIAPVVKPANNEIWYTNGSTTAATTPYNTSAFGATIVSNTYDAEKECWVITFDGDVTSIGDNAFYNCDSLTSITIPDSVTSIGEGAFYDCSGLTSITIPNSVTSIGKHAFTYCYSLTSVTIPDGVTSIGESTFFNCTSLTSVNIPAGVTTIGDNAFYNCDSLTSITIPDSVTKIGNSAFHDCSGLTSITIPDSVTSIGEGAFTYCNSLVEFKGKFATDDGLCLIVNGTIQAFAIGCGATKYTIPNSVTKIGEGAFALCNSLTSITIPDGVTSIESFAFSGCSSLTSVTIGSGVTKIGDYAFNFCSSLTKVYCTHTTPPSLGGYYVFRENASGRKIYVPTASVEAYKSASYWSVYENSIVANNSPLNNEIWYTNGSTTVATAPYKTNVFGANIVSNTYDATKKCWVIKFDGNVTAIGDYAFYYCGSLTSITIPEGVTSIGDGAFSNCYRLPSVTIPNSVTEIGSVAFFDCINLTRVYCKATTPPYLGLGSCVFYYEDDETYEYIELNCMIYVPSESASAYRSEWNRDNSYRIIGYDDIENEKSDSGTDKGYAVVLNNAWQKSTTVSNPDSSLYNGVYESYSNYNVNNGVATMYIHINGYTEFSFYIRSYAESNYDYVMVSQLDKTITGSTEYSNTTLVKAHTRGNQQSGSSISNYTKVTYSNISSGTHCITIVYRKDSSQHSGADRGYILIPKNQ